MNHKTMHYVKSAIGVCPGHVEHALFFKGTGKLHSKYRKHNYNSLNYINNH